MFNVIPGSKIIFFRKACIYVVSLWTWWMHYISRSFLAFIIDYVGSLPVV